METESNEEIRAMIHDMHQECRQNVSLYDSPSGIKVTVDEMDWAVVYWPRHPIGTLDLMRDWQKLEKPASYRVKPDKITKNVTVASRASGGILLDPSGEQVVTDLYEIATLQKIISAAHKSKIQESESVSSTGGTIPEPPQRSVEEFLPNPSPSKLQKIGKILSTGGLSAIFERDKK